MECLMGVWLRKLNHHPLAAPFSPPESFFLVQDTINYPLGVNRSREKKIEIPFQGLHPRKTGRGAQSSSHNLGQLLSSLGNVYFLARLASLFGRHLEKRGRNAPLPTEWNPGPMQD